MHNTEDRMLASNGDKIVNLDLEERLNEIYSQYYNDVMMIKEFLENIDKLLTQRQNKKKKSISGFSDEDKDQLKKFFDFIGSVVEDNEKNKMIENGQDALKEIDGTTDNITKSKSSKNKTLTLNSEKVSEFIMGFVFPQKQKKYLAEMALSYLISYQETFIKEYIKEILTSRRNLLKSKKTLTFEEICDFISIDSLFLHMAQEEIDKTLYGGIDDIADYLEKRLHISLQSDFADWKKIREASFRRNLIIHNNGITNKIYCLKTDYQTTNQELTTDTAYVINATNSILSFFDFMHLRLCEQLGLPQPELKDTTPNKRVKIKKRNKVLDAE